MATDENYLDNLLKSLTENEQQTRTMEDAMRSVTQPDQAKNTSAVSDSPETDSSDIVFDDMDDWQSNLDELLAQANAQVEDNQDSVDTENTGSVEDIGSIEDIGSTEDAGSAEVTENTGDEDIWGGINFSASEDEMDADLKEINGLLNTSDTSGNVEDDMLALLEGIGDDYSEDNNQNDAFDIFSDNGAELLLDEGTEDTQQIEQPPKEKSPKRKLFSRKKGSKKTEEAEGTEELSDSENTQESQEKGEKKPGFFARALDYLTREEEDTFDLEKEETDLLKEEAKKAKKEEKKRKKAEKKKKGKTDAAPEGEEGEPAADTEKEKKKKEKKEKREQKKKEKQAEREAQKEKKPVKVLSRRNLLVLVAICATLIASICLLSTLLPEYADRQNARQAFYDGNYEEAYGLLYDKKLDGSDEVIFNRVRIVLTIERKLNSYENNMAMGRELEALDALLQGARCYQELNGIDEYGVREEADRVYQQICSILQDNYNILQEEISEINTYDNETYTKKLHSVIDGTEFVLPGEEEPEEDPTPRDILPEEEEIINY